jgi:hypothetical protein
LPILRDGSSWREAHFVIVGGSSRASILPNNKEKESDDSDKNDEKQKDKEQRSAGAHFIPR